MANNQCPNCGHRFSDREMLFWGFSRISSCPDCGVQLRVNSNRILMLGFGGIIAIIYIEENYSLQTFHGWLAIAVFVVLFCLVAVRVQKLEIEK